MTHVDHAAEGIRVIDEGIERVEHLTIEHALGHAVLAGTMEIEEAMSYLAAYESTFNA